MQLSSQKAPPGGAGTASNAPATGPKVRTLAELIDAYQAAYAGRDPSRPRTLSFWRGELGPERPFHERGGPWVYATVLRGLGNAIEVAKANGARFLPAAR